MKELIHLREFGKLAPCPWWKGSLLLCKEQGAVTRGARLFNKNIGSCKVEMLSIGADACPVPVP